MLQNTLEEQITALLKAGRSGDEISRELAAPASLIEALWHRHQEQLADKNARASSLHNQATYAMNLDY